MINPVAVLQTTANISCIAMEVNEGRHAASLLFGMTDEVRMEGNFVASLYVNDFKGQCVDFRWRDACPVRSNVGVEEKIVLDGVKHA